MVPRALTQPEDQVHDLAAGIDVEIAGRLVRQQDLRIVDQGPRQRDALLLAAR